MNITGIIAEFNPLHRGHEHILKTARKNGADGVVCVMSGNFVQRGDAAVFNKFDRAECAVKSGADLIIEMPAVYCLSSAEGFAEGGTTLLQALGCVDTILFGSECGDSEQLEKTAAALLSLDKSDLLEHLDAGISYASAIGKALKKMGINLSSPNDILAVEYIKALRKSGCDMMIKTVKRTGSYHMGGAGTKGAEEIRNAIFSAEADDVYLQTHLSEECFLKYKHLERAGRAPANLKYADRAIISFFRTADPEKLGDINGMTEGLQNRIVSAAAESRTVNELFEAVKTKRYAMTAVRRAVMCAWLGIRKNTAPPPYIRVLAFNRTGAEILKEAKRKANLPIIFSLARAARLGQTAKDYAVTELKCGEAYSVLTPQIVPGREELTRGVRITGGD